MGKWWWWVDNYGHVDPNLRGLSLKYILKDKPQYFFRIIFYLIKTFHSP